jgi:hypothetical protein
MALLLVTQPGLVFFRESSELCYVQVVAIENMKTIAYVSRHHARTARIATIPLFSRNCLARWKAERKLDANYKDLDDLPKLTKGDDATILDFIGDFPEKLAQITGTDGRPLGYAIREDEIPPLTADDPLIVR